MAQMCVKTRRLDVAEVCMYVCMYVCICTERTWPPNVALFCAWHILILYYVRCVLETWVMFAELQQFEKRRKNARITWYVCTVCNVCMYVYKYQRAVMLCALPIRVVRWTWRWECWPSNSDCSTTPLKSLERSCIHTYDMTCIHTVNYYWTYLYVSAPN